MAENPTASLEIVWLDPAALVPYPQNTKTHSSEQIEAIAAQIEAHGFDQPIVTEGNLVIIKGHGRREASLLLKGRGKLAAVPVIVRSDLTAEQVRAARIADNKVAESPWDFGMLKLEIGGLLAGGFDLGLTGFGADEIASMMAPPVNPDEQRDLAIQSLASKFGVPPFSVLRAADGWWQDRKRAWISLGIESEVGRGENLIGRSIFDRLSMILGGHYSEIKAYVDKHRAEGLDDAQIEALAVKETGRDGANGSNRLAAGGGGLSDRMAKGEGTSRAKRPAVPGNGKSQGSTGAHADMAYMKKKNAAAKGKA